jgi:hypothetical protein
MVGTRYTPVVVFMTDGEANSVEAEKILASMYNDSMNRNFPLWTFCLGFNVKI